MVVGRRQELNPKMNSLYKTERFTFINKHERDDRPYLVRHMLIPHIRLFTNPFKRITFFLVNKYRIIFQTFESNSMTTGITEPIIVPS